MSKNITELCLNIETAILESDIPTIETLIDEGWSPWMHSSLSRSGDGLDLHVSSIPKLQKIGTLFSKASSPILDLFDSRFPQWPIIFRNDPCSSFSGALKERVFKSRLPGIRSNASKGLAGFSEVVEQIMGTTFTLNMAQLLVDDWRDAPVQEKTYIYFSLIGLCAHSAFKRDMPLETARACADLFSKEISWDLAASVQRGLLTDTIMRCALVGWMDFTSFRKYPPPSFTSLSAPGILSLSRDFSNKTKEIITSPHPLMEPRTYWGRFDFQGKFNKSWTRSSVDSLDLYLMRCVGYIHGFREVQGIPPACPSYICFQTQISKGGLRSDNILESMRPFIGKPGGKGFAKAFRRKESDQRWQISIRKNIHPAFILSINHDFKEIMDAGSLTPKTIYEIFAFSQVVNREIKPTDSAFIESLTLAQESCDPQVARRNRL